MKKLQTSDVFTLFEIDWTAEVFFWKGAESVELNLLVSGLFSDDRGDGLNAN